VSTPAEPNDSAVAQDNLESENIVASDSVFEATGTACIGGDISAQGGLFEAGGVGRVEEISAHGVRTKFGGDDARLDNGHSIGGGYLQNPIHFHEGDDEATTDGNAAAHVTATRAAGGDGNAVAVGEGEDFRDLFGGTGKGDSGGKGGSYPSVGGVGLKGGRVETKSAFGEESRKGAERIFHLRR
jgi:hypothetical protein